MRIVLLPCVVVSCRADVCCVAPKAHRLGIGGSGQVGGGPGQGGYVAGIVIVCVEQQSVYGVVVDVDGDLN